MVDCSHANSEKNHEKQPFVLENVIDQIVNGNRSISSVMIESFIEGGNQPIPKDLTQLKYGLSITDKCIDWSTTERILLEAHARLKKTGGRKLA
jgi:3-deoxy-7-phosphoheptulonate synthase